MVAILGGDTEVNTVDVTMHLNATKRRCVLR